MPAAIPRASRSPPPRWPPSPSNVTRYMASGTTPSHPTSSRYEAVIPRQILSGQAFVDLGRARHVGLHRGTCAPVGDHVHCTRVAGFGLVHLVPRPLHLPLG